MSSRWVIMLAALALSACGKPLAKPMTTQEQAAVEMLRLGYDRWAVACAFTSAKQGRSIDEAQRSCRVDFNLGKEIP
jgi:hypothetical protein